MFFSRITIMMGVVCYMDLIENNIKQILQNIEYARSKRTDGSAADGVCLIAVTKNHDAEAVKAAAAARTRTHTLAGLHPVTRPAGRNGQRSGFSRPRERGTLTGNRRELENNDNEKVELFGVSSNVVKSYV